jgi:hypothetical protein
MPSQEVVQKALAEISKRPANYEYFFDQLRSPDWIQPLFENGLFQKPPDPIREGDYIKFPFWPESQYLARVASLAPERVLDIALRIETDNVRVHEDLADAACTMPPNLAAQWATKEAQWVKNQEYLYFVLPEKLAALVVHLAKGGQVDAALDLARSLLAILPDSHIGERVDVSEYFRPPEPRARFEEWSYAEILKKHREDLVATAGEPALQLLCDLLEDSTRLSRGAYDAEVAQSRPYQDNLYIQRPAIEEHDQNQPTQLIDSLISAVRDSLEQLATEDPMVVQHLVTMLEQREWQIFHRLALYLLWRFPEAAPDLVSQRLTDRGRFDELGLRHEYALLARSCFATLDTVDKEKILRWIEEGPNLDLFTARYEEREGNSPSEEDANRYADLWQRDRLALFSNGLPEEWERRYDTLIEEYGPAEHPEFATYTTAMWVGPTSPIGTEDLRSMSVEEIARYLSSWEPSGDFMTPSPEGLGRELASVITSDPEHFAASSSYFRGLDPTYVRTYFNGLRDAAKQGRAFPWSPVLDLCQWVIQQPREILGREVDYKGLIEHHDLDPDWGWTRKAIAELLSQGFEDSNAQIPFELRTKVWGVLRPLTNDPDPTPEHEARYGGSNMDPATLSLDTTRSEAMHAVVRYGLWVRRNLEQTVSEDELAAQGFGYMPEVQDVLDHRLDPSVEPSLAVRAVYGWWFPHLTWLDERWATRNVPRIFPSAESLRDLHSAAWKAFLIFSYPNVKMLHILSDEYSDAIDRLSSIPSERWLPADPDRRLAEHLATFYWWGVLDVGDPQDLLQRFYSHASDALRAHALGFLGRNLHRISGEVPTTNLERLKALWQTRLRAAQELPSSHAEEVGEFGWWFASAKFEASWALTQLKEALKLTAEVEPYTLLLDRLAALAPTMPLDTVECLQLIIEGDKEGWRTGAFREAKRNILRAVLHSQDHEARQVAENLINRLGAQGFWNFRDLLHEAR